MMHLLFPIMVLATLLSRQAFAWNAFGHMTIAAAAYEQLTPTARTKVNELLKLNPQYPEWINGIPESERDETAFIKASTWPDYIKRAQGYKNDGETPSNPGASQNLGYEDKLMHRYWHYIDLPFSPDGTPLIQPQSPNAQTQIAAFRATLTSRTASDELKSYDLVWLIHLVGDVHQPLHATSRFTRDEPDGDRGGNEVALCEKPCRNELHAFWDNALGTSNKPVNARKFAHYLPTADAQRVAVRDEVVWIQESFNVAKESVYVDPIGSGSGPYALTPEYRANARKVAKERAAPASARLARLINSALQ